MKMWGKKWGGTNIPLPPPKQKSGGGSCPPCPPPPPPPPLPTPVINNFYCVIIINWWLTRQQISKKHDLEWYGEQHEALLVQCLNETCKICL